ncbi:MAG: hypothetical protein BWX50_01214 [Euryarchaeota archaeon ADurb.Bin009]|nr:MAG: hypothetical protein BWX50_01214 [Euryarchaeota archaeon ADurb.Bin009]
MPSCIWMPLSAANAVTRTRRTSSPAASGRTPLPIVVIDRFISQTAIVRMEEARLMVIPGSLRGAYLCGATY